VNAFVGNNPTGALITSGLPDSGATNGTCRDCFRWVHFCFPTTPRRGDFLSQFDDRAFCTSFSND